jgi:hypothetical protein
MVAMPGEPADEVVPTEAPRPEGEVDFATYVTIEAALSEGLGPLALLLDEEGVARAEDYARAREQYETMRAKSAEVEAGFQRMMEYFVEDARARKRARERERDEEARAKQAELVRESPPPREPIVQAVPEPERPRAPLQGTALSLDVPRGPALPFAKAPSAPPPPAPPTSPSDPAAPPRPALSGTALALELPRLAPLPFAAQAPVKRPPDKLAGTLPLGGGPLPLPATPFRASEPSARASSPPAEAPALRLTLEQHASLCAELACYAGHEPAVLERHSLTTSEKTALDDHYRAVVQESPAARLQWNRTFQATSSWLAKQRR